VSEEIVVPDTGSTRGDVLVLMREAVGLYRGSLAARLMPNLIGAIAQKAELARAVREEFLAPGGRRSAPCFGGASSDALHLRQCLHLPVSSRGLAPHTVG
jgi:Tetracyclin repressor-like, C-terminal domain